MLTKQEIFDKVVTRAQTKRRCMQDGTCMYRNEAGEIWKEAMK